MNSPLTTPPSTPGLCPAQFARAFPFYLAWDRNLRIIASGESLQKICPEAIPGGLLTEILDIKRPSGTFSPGFFQDHLDLLFLFAIKCNGITLRGQVLPTDADGGFLLLASPWLSEPEQAAALDLTFSDFAIHDQTMDMLQIVQAQRMANTDLHKLTDKLTEQRAKLRAQETESRKLALVAARTDNAVIVTDAQGRIEWVNEGFVCLTGYTLEESAGRRPGEFLQGPETDPDTVDLMREKVAAGGGFRTEVLNYDRHGNKYWVSIEVQPVHNEEGVLTNFTAVETNITERVQDEQRRGIQYSVSRILAGIHSLEQAASRIVQTICKRLGWQVGCLWLLDDSGDFLFLGGSWQDPAADVSAFIDTSKSLTFEFGQSQPGGVWKNRHSEWIPDLATFPAFTRSAAAARCGLGSTLALPFFNGGEFQGMMEFFHPVIEEPDETLLQTLDGICNQIGQFIVRKKAESELIRSKNAAESANRAKSDFLATMSHEIRTPMNGVLGFTQLLQQSPLSSQQNEFVSAIRSSAEALLTVINDVLDFSKIESGRMDLDSHPFSLQSCLEEALETVSTSAAEKQLDLAARLGADVPASVIGDGLRLRQVLVNLLGNAVKFTLQGEVQLNVSTFPTHSENVGLEFSVRDSGIGIPTDQMQTLFQPFRQGDSSISRCFGGTGLGLAICRRLVELMGGTISATSIPGEGSVFFFRLEFAASATPPPLVNPASFPSLAGRRALVVDGHHLSREAILEILGRWGLEARASASPDLAADVVREWKPDVLLLDSACTDPAGVSFAKNLSEQGTALFVMCQPTDGRTVRERFDGEIAGTLFKPMKVSPLFNALLAHHDQKDSRTPGSHRPLIPVQTRTRPLRLLLAEDNAINRKLALAALNQMGCTADVAVDGHEALRAAKATRYDAILMDVQMPGMDGLESTQYIRQWEAQTGTPRTRIIALTANALSGDREICLQAGMDDYLSKPIRLEALRATLQQVCDASPSEVARSVPVEPMTAPSAATLALQQLAGELSASDAAALAADFLDDLPNQLQAIRASLLAGNAEESKRHAHSLKGTSSIFRLEGLQRASDTVETASRENRLTDATAAFALLEAASTAAVRDLRNAVSALAATAVLQPMS